MSIFDVSKGNQVPFLTTALAAPFLAVAVVLLFLYAIFASIACLIGRRAVFNLVYELHTKVFDR